EDPERGVLERLAGLELVLEKVHDDLGVGLRRELVPGRNEWRLQLLEVLDDPVVDDRGRGRAVDVRVRVLLRRPAVRRPTRVADAGLAIRWVRRDDRGEVVELSLRAHDVEMSVLLKSDTRRVVAAVLVASQSGHQQWKRRAWTDVADDPAHQTNSSPLMRAPAARCPRDAARCSQRPARPAPRP